MHEKGWLNLAYPLFVWFLVLACPCVQGASPSPETASVTLAWDAPVSNTDGTPVGNLTGYRLYCGTAPHTYSTVITVGLTPTATVSNLQTGVTYYFAVVACNDAGVESSYSTELAWTSTALPPLDSDSDGSPDSQELAAGTDPNDPGSVLKMQVSSAPPETNNPGFVVQWTSVPGKFYTVLRSRNLAGSPAFSPLVEHIPGLGPVTSYTDTDINSSGSYFYKIQVE